MSPGGSPARGRVAYQGCGERAAVSRDFLKMLVADRGCWALKNSSAQQCCSGKHRVQRKGRMPEASAGGGHRWAEIHKTYNFREGMASLLPLPKTATLITLLDCLQIQYDRGTWHCLRRNQIIILTLMTWTVRSQIFFQRLAEIILMFP